MRDKKNLKLYKICTFLLHNMNDKQIHYYSVTMFSVNVISLEFQVLDITCVSSVDDEADFVTLK